MKNKKTILVFIGYYLPGYKSGGPVRTISNMLDLLGDKYNFKIITQDRDKLDDKPYENIKVNEWNDGANCKIFYANKKTNLRKVINSTEFDQYYLNSLFDFNFSIKIVLFYNLKLIPQKPILLAPRGELLEGALSLKSLKKKVFLLLVKILKLYKNVTWHASSHYEENAIKNIFGKKICSRIALDVPNYNLEQPEERIHKKEKGKLKILFISNIKRNKNLKFAIQVLNKVEGNFILDIYGPIYEEKYWQECLSEIDNSKIDSIKYLGPIDNTEIDKVYPNYDLFFFPTLSENYGHVIFESLFFGCPVLTTKNTPWDMLEKFNAGWTLELKEYLNTKEIIEQLIYFDEHTYNKFVKGANKYIKSFDKQVTVKKYLNLFN